MLTTRKSAAWGLRQGAPTLKGELSLRCCKAGLRGQQAPPPRRCTALASALSLVAARDPWVTSRYRVCVAAAATGMGHRDKEEDEEFTEEAEQQMIVGQSAEAPVMTAPQVGDGKVAAQPSAAIPAETEAMAAAGQQQHVVSEEVEEEVEQVVEPLTFRLVASRSQTYLTTTLPGKLLLGGLAVAFLGTLLLAIYRAWQKSNTAQAKRMRQIDRNRDLVDGLNKYLLNGNRAGLTPGVLRKLQRASGFSTVEVFRKYLWYLLRERKFDQGGVEDLVAMKLGLGLSDADVGEALRERATRIYDKYGTLMLNTDGLTLSGAQRKATCTALFRKVLYLAECDRLVGPAANEPGGSGAGSVADIGKIFGATIEDMERLRIRNLYEAELDLEGMIADSTDDDMPAPPAPEGPSKAGRR